MDSVNFSPVDFFIQAGPAGKFVMAILALSSIWCWVLIIEGIVGVLRLKKALNAVKRGERSLMLAAVMEAGRGAQALNIPGEGVGETRMRIIETMNRAARVVLSNVEGGLANLAVISSVAPFVGLFGTVWGIMSAFASIAAAKDTSLAVVAPGIAEALATTAFGLAAAIPASIGYTRIGAAISAQTGDLASLIEEEALNLVVSHGRSAHAPVLKEVK